MGNKKASKLFVKKIHSKTMYCYKYFICFFTYKSNFKIFIDSINYSGLFFYYDSTMSNSLSKKYQQLIQQYIINN